MPKWAKAIDALWGRATRIALLVIVAAAAGLGVVALVPRASASAGDCEDTFDCRSLATDFNAGQPFTASASMSMSIDMSNDTLQNDERSGCDLVGGGARFGENSVWFRLDPAVKGSLNVTADTTADPTPFQVFMIPYTGAHSEPPEIDYTNPSELITGPGCTGKGDKESFDTGVAVPAGVPTYVQVLAFCQDVTTEPVTQPPACTGANSVPAGLVHLQITFTATDTDGDGVPDTVDACPATPGPASLNGCPDSDGDGVPDIKDACPTVPAPGTANGCPAATTPIATTPIATTPTTTGPKHPPAGSVDRDHDGIPNSKDSCPTQKGPKDTSGCPDRDHDGIADKLDKCPRTFAAPGLATSGVAPRGCPGPVAASLPYDFFRGEHVRGTTVLFSVLGHWVAHAPRGSSVTLSCTGPGCPAAWPVTASLGRRMHLDLIPILRHVHSWRAGGGRVRLPARTSVTATVSARGTLSRQLTLTGTESFTLRCQSRDLRLAACAT
jgi:hypothetical protein